MGGWVGVVVGGGWGWGGWGWGCAWSTRVRGHGAGLCMTVADDAGPSSAQATGRCSRGPHTLERTRRKTRCWMLGSSGSTATLPWRSRSSFQASVSVGGQVGGECSTDHSMHSCCCMACTVALGHSSKSSSSSSSSSGSCGGGGGSGSSSPASDMLRITPTSRENLSQHRQLLQQVGGSPHQLLPHLLQPRAGAAHTQGGGTRREGGRTRHVIVNSTLATPPLQRPAQHQPWLRPPPATSNPGRPTPSTRGCPAPVAASTVRRGFEAEPLLLPSLKRCLSPTHPPTHLPSSPAASRLIGLPSTGASASGSARYSSAGTCG